MKAWMKMGCICKCKYNGVQAQLYLYLNFLPGFRPISTSSTKEGNPSSSSSSLTNFLVNSLDFSNQLSLSTSARFANWRQFTGTKTKNYVDGVDNAHSVVQYLYQLGFHQSDIKKLVCFEPRLLVSNVEKTLKTKIKLLNDVGVSGSDLVLVVTRNPSVLRYRLNSSIYAFRFVLGSDEGVVKILKHFSWIRLNNAAKYLIPNFQLLQNYCALSTDYIRKYIHKQPRLFMLRTDLFRDILVRVEENLGIPRHSGLFLYGIQLLASYSEKNIEDKCQVFKSFGWTQSDIMDLVRRNPLCLTFSEATIKKKLVFLMNQLSYKPSLLATLPSFFTCSLEKRLLPRHRVIQVLKEKGFLRMDYPLYSATGLTESRFLKRFVLPFEEAHDVYAQLTGSTVGSLNVGGTRHHIKKSLDSNAARCKVSGDI